MAQKTAWDGAALTESDINTYLMGEGGAWTTHTPTVDQSGTVTHTTTYSKYARYGRTIHWTFNLAITGAGTAGQLVTLTMPATAAANCPIVGMAQIYDLSTVTSYTVLVLGASTTTIFFPASQASANGWGNTPNLALASGDLIRGHVTYEAAS